MNAPNTPPPGWYPDPSGQAPFRYWDGTRWTEHTNQGAPAPVQPVQYAPQPGTPPVPGAPGMPGMPGVPGMPAMGGMPGGAATPAAAKPLTAQGFLEDLKQLDGFAVMLAAAALFIIATFLAWGSVKGQGYDPNTGVKVFDADETSNLWDGDGAWLILGADTDTSSLTQVAQGGKVDGNTDLLVLGPLLLVAVGVAVAMRQGKQISNGNQIIAGAAALFGVLVIAEVFHLSSAASDIESFYKTYIGGDWSVGVAYGAWIGAIAAVGVAFGGVRHYMATKTA